MTSLSDIGKRIKAASLLVAGTHSERREAALLRLADLILSQQEGLLEANRADLKAGEAAGLTPPLLDRLSLEGRLEAIGADVRMVAALKDPIGEVFESFERPDGLKISKHRVPIGVIGVIYEARPNVTVDIAALAIKTANGALLRGGKEALLTNMAFAKLITQALVEEGLPSDLIHLIETPDRAVIEELLRLHHYIDLIIPRGGAALHALCREKSTIPVITGGIGVCHLFVDSEVEWEGAFRVISNSKIRRPSVCNALETLLVHSAIAVEFIPAIAATLPQVEFSCDERAFKLLSGQEGVMAQLAHPSDWDREWLSLKLGIKVVDGITEAIHHIGRHSTGHSDGILTESVQNAERFVREVDSAAVYVNAATCFTDGAQFGLGAEAAVSTQKIHARGPLGLKELTSYKWVVQGTYATRS